MLVFSPASSPQDFLAYSSLFCALFFFFPFSFFSLASSFRQADKILHLLHRYESEVLQFADYLGNHSFITPSEDAEK